MLAPETCSDSKAEQRATSYSLFLVSYMDTVETYL